MMNEKYENIKLVKPEEHPDINDVNTEYTRVSVNRIVTDVDISQSLDSVLAMDNLVNEINELVLKDTNERYIRELINRNKELEERIEYLERSNNRREDTILELRDEVVEHDLYKHRLDTANEYIESRKEHMIIDHYDDLKYILNECDLESKW